MKKVLYMIFSAAVLLSSTGCLAGPNVIRGNGHPARGAFDISTDYTELAVSQGITVEFILSDRPDGTITADENILDYVSIVENGGRIKVSYEPHISVSTKTRTVVSLPLSRRLRRLKVSSAARVESTSRVEFSDLRVDLSSAAVVDLALTGGSLEVSASSAAKFMGDLAVEKLDVTLSSAAKCEAHGHADECEVGVSSAAHFSGFDLVCRRVDVNASSAGSVAITATEALDVNVSSGGAVKYKGSPARVKQNVSSGGSLKSID